MYARFIFLMIFGRFIPDVAAAELVCRRCGNLWLRVFLLIHEQMEAFSMWSAKADPSTSESARSSRFASPWFFRAFGAVFHGARPVERHSRSQASASPHAHHPTSAVQLHTTCRTWQEFKICVGRAIKHLLGGRFLSLSVNPASQPRTFNKVIAILLSHGLLKPPQTVSQRWCIRKRCIASFELLLHLEILLMRFHPLRRKHVLVYLCSACELTTSSRKYRFWRVSRGRRPSLFLCDDKRDKVTKMASVFDLLWRSYHFPFALFFFLNSLHRFTRAVDHIRVYLRTKKQISMFNVQRMSNHQYSCSFSHWLSR